MIDAIVIVVISLLIILAIKYIAKEKAKGNHCIGCPYSGSCDKSTSCSQKTS